MTNSTPERRRQLASAEASMNRTSLDCFGVASSGSGGLIERSGWDLRQPVSDSRGCISSGSVRFAQERGIDPIESGV
jgi:hypothetical protein